ncbi:MAG: TrkA family potassium uptake protein [Halobacteriota archaeon]|nr:TrkA family potassium uptake protein [Halobacteriota archaeon]
MYIIVVGLGGIGRNLVYLATEERHNVVIIDKDAERCRDIAGKYDVITFVGDATTKSLLEEAGADRADSLITTTSDDATNLMTVLVAKDLGIKNIVSVVNDQDHADMFKRAGVNIQENPDLAVAQQLFWAMERPKNIKDVIRIGDGKAEIFEVAVTNISPVAGKSLSQLSLQGEGLVVAIDRGDKILVPKGDTRILPGDKITIFAQSKYVEKMVSMFA